MMITIPLSFVSLQRLKNALRKTGVEELITEWRDYIIKTNTKPNSVISFLIKFNNASIMTIVHLLIQ
jgi:hypothetical protein